MHHWRINVPSGKDALIALSFKEMEDDLWEERERERAFQGEMHYQELPFNIHEATTSSKLPLHTLHEVRCHSKYFFFVFFVNLICLEIKNNDFSFLKTATVERILFFSPRLEFGQYYLFC